MKVCGRCGRAHVGLLIYGSPMFLLFFQQEFEQWCDQSLTEQELAQIRSLPMVKLPSSPLQSFLAMANAIDL